MNYQNLLDFLDLQSRDLSYLEYVTGVKLKWYQKMHIKMMNKLWNSIKEENNHLKPVVLLESIFKGRF
jgi:hypothetical protein